MMLRGGTTSKLTRGLMLAHEVGHAQDCLLHGEPETNQIDDNWLVGELNAHAKVMMILNEWTDGGWKKIVAASQERRVAMTVAMGKRPESSLFGQLPEDREMFVAQFGELDDISAGLYFFQLDVDANIKNVNTQMKNYGRPEEEAMAHYIDVIRALYAKYEKDIRLRD